MPDLSIEGSHKFWKDYKDKSIYRVITFMESVEKWTLDGNSDLEAAMQRLGAQLDNITEFESGKEDQLIQISNSIKSGRGLRLLQSFDTISPGAASKILLHAEETSEDQDDPAGLFLKRNVVFERLRLLGRVFSKERLELVLKALEQEHD